MKALTEAAAKILVADDDQSLVRTLTWILKENGYDVVTAPGGEGLIGKLEEERPNLLLLDIMMPKVDGLQLLAKMKADDRFRDVPVLMISSMPPEEATVKSLGLGAADFISKPFRVRELLARVKAHIRSAQELAHARDEAQSRAAIVDILHDGVVFQDANGRIIACNTAAERILDLRADEMIGRAFGRTRRLSLPSVAALA